MTRATLLLTLFAPLMWAFQCDPIALTQGNGEISESPAISDDGSVLVFQSTGDYTGTNADGNPEIFLRFANGTYQQVTQTTSGDVNSSPTIDGSGRYVAFQSTANLTGNTSGRYEIYLWDRLGSLDQISDSTGGTRGAVLPRIARDGSALVYLNDGDPLGANTDHSDEVFWYDRVQDMTVQVSGGIVDGQTTDAGSATINDDGTQIAYSKLAVPARTYIYDFTLPGLSTVSLNSIGNPAISGDGSVVFFQSNADLVGNNGDGNEEIYRYDRGSMAYSQITDTTSGFIDSESLQSQGAALFFVSDVDFVGNNPANDNQWFRYSPQGTIRQVTGITSGASLSGLDATPNGFRILYSHNQSGAFEIYQEGISDNLANQIPNWPGSNLLSLLALFCP